MPRAANPIDLAGTPLALLLKVVALEFELAGLPRWLGRAR